MKTADMILKELADQGSEDAKHLLEIQNHMLTLRDACNVIYRFLVDYTDFFREDRIDETEELLRILIQEFEQKCYIGKPQKDFDYALSEINPQSIAYEIANDRLSKWCKFMQIDLQMRIADALKKGD